MKTILFCCITLMQQVFDTSFSASLLVEEKQILHRCHHKEIIMPTPLREHPVRRIMSFIKIYEWKKANISSIWRTSFFKVNPTKDVTFEQESHLSSNDNTFTPYVHSVSSSNICFSRVLSNTHTSVQKSVKLLSY